MHSSGDLPESAPVKPSLGSASGSPRSVWSTLLSLSLFIGIYYLLVRDLLSVLLLVLVLLVHEMGHFAAMKIFGYSDVRLLFVPLFGAFVSGHAGTVSPFKKSIMILAGPIPGILVGLICLKLYSQSSYPLLYTLALLFMGLNALNLLPVSPLDGGQLLETLFFRSNFQIQVLFLISSVLLVLFLSVRTGNIFILIIGVFILQRLRTTVYLQRSRNKLRLAGTAIGKTYDELTDSEYRLMRDTLAGQQEGKTERTEVNHSKEEKAIASVIYAILRHNSPVPVTPTQKLLVTLIWLLGLLLPLLGLAGLPLSIK